MKFLLVGGTGYVGGRLAQYLKEQGHQVSVTTRRPAAEAPAWLAADRVIRTDLSDRREIAAALSGQEAVVHLAAPDEVAAAQNPREAVRAGGELTWNLLETAAALPHPPTFLTLSTFHVYGRNGRGDVAEDTLPAPAHPYSLGRYLAEAVTQLFRRTKGVPALCVRMSNAFGAPAGRDVPRWTLVFNDLCRQAVERKELVIRSSGTQRRNFITLHDVVRGLEFLSLRPERWPEDGVIHLGSPLHLTIREAAERVARCAQGVLGESPAVRVLGKDPEEPTELNFRLDRLAAMGFAWTGSIEREIEATLKMCLASPAV